MENQGNQNSESLTFGQQFQQIPKASNVSSKKRSILKSPIFWIVTLAILLLLAGCFAVFSLIQGNESSDQNQVNSINPAERFDSIQLPLSDLNISSESLQGARVLSINGRLEVNDSFVLAPSSQPTEAVAGQIYFNQDTNLLTYYNGLEYIELTSPESAAQSTTTSSGVQSIGGLNGAIDIGTGLSASGGVLTNTGVISILGSGPLSSSGGQSPTISLDNGTSSGQIWQWDGNSWELATLPAEQDAIIGNEVSDVIVGGGLKIRGSATAADPLKLGLRDCALDEVLKSNGAGGWTCESDAGGVSYTAGNGLQLVASQFAVDSPACSGTDKLQWNGSAFICSADVNTDTDTTYTAGSGLNLVGTTFSNNGVLTVTGSGAVTSSGGQNPDIALADGASVGQIWQWDGDSWELATIAASEGDGVIGNEVTNAAASAGLTRSGSGTAVDPYLLGLQSCATNQILKSTSPGVWACAADGGDGDTTYTADGEGIELTGTTFGLELNGTSLAKDASGLTINLSNANTWAAAQTFGAGIVLSASQTITISGDSIDRFDGTGLVVLGGDLQTTLGTSVDLTSEVTGTLPTANGGTGLSSVGTAHQLLGMDAAGTNLEYKNIASLLSAGSGINISGTNNATISNTGVLTVTGSGPVTSTGGQNPDIAFADGTSSGEFWQWDGDSWELATLPAEQDAVVGNEVTNVTGASSGLTRSGSGTALNPYTLAVNTGNGIQISSNNIAIDSPTCSGTDKLQWNGTAFVCSADVDTDTNTTYTADGNGLELTGTTFGLELNGASLATGASGLSINLSNVNTWAAAQTFGAGITLSALQTITIGGDSIDEFAGTGLTVSGGDLQTTLGTSVDLTSEVTGTLPTANGGTGLSSVGTAHQLLGMDATGTNLEYKNIASLLTAGSGINITGTNNATIANTGVLTVSGSGAVTSSGGQNPAITLVDGSSAGQFWQWDGDSWELALDIGTDITCNVAGNFLCVGGNTLGGSLELGTNDANSLILETNNTDVMTIASGGAISVDGTMTITPVSDSTTVFKVEAQTSGNSVFLVDTTNERVAIGVVGGVPSAKLHIATASTVGLRVYEGGAYDVLQLQNATGSLLTVSQTGAFLSQNTTNSTSAFRILDSAGTTTLFNVDTTNGRVGIGGAATFSIFEVLGGDFGLYNSGGDPRFIVGDSTVSGQYGYLQWDSTNDYFRIEKNGSNGLKINDNYVTIGNVYPDRPLRVANGVTTLFDVGTTGIATFQNSANSTSAFRVLESTGGNMLTVDTTNDRVYIGEVSTGSHASAELVFGDFGDDSFANIFIGEYGAGDSDMLQIHSDQGTYFTTEVSNSQADRMIIDLDGVNIVGDGSFGSGGRLYFGDSDYAYLGEYGTGDSDALVIHGSDGIYLNAGYSDTDIGLLDSSGFYLADDLSSPAFQTRWRVNSSENKLDISGANLAITTYSGANFDGTSYGMMTLYSSSSRMDFRANYNYFVPSADSTSTIDVATAGTDTTETLMRFVKGGVVQGSITVSGSTVSYNAFTGSHYAWTNQNISRGEVVIMTGDNKYRSSDSLEPFYGIVKSTQANDPRVLGSYLSRIEDASSFSFDTPDQVMSVGNGEMWVTDEGGNIKPGDLLITSTTPGHSMRDKGQFPTSYVIARASENVNWNNETQVINGRKHKRISVLFDSFTVLNAVGLQQAVFNGGIVTGNTTFDALVAFNGQTIFKGGSTFEGDVRFKGNVAFANNTAGTVTVEAGKSKAKVEFNKSHTNTPVVNITPKQFINGSYIVKDVKPEEFTIELNQVQSEDIEFNWTAFTSK